MTAITLTETGRNGQIASFFYKNTDGRTALIKHRRVINQTANCWEVLPEGWFIYEPGWALADPTPRDDEEG